MSIKIGTFGARVFAAVLVVLLLVLYGSYSYYNRYVEKRTARLSSFQLHQTLPDFDGYNLVLLGDSRIAQWRPLPEYIKTIPIGLAGGTTFELRAIADSFPDTDSKTVVVQAGLNDIHIISLMPRGNRSDLLEQSITNLASLMHHLSQLGWRVIWVETLPAVRPEILRRLVFDVDDRTVNDFNNEVRKRLKPSIASIDLHEIFAVNGTIPEEYLSDSVHWTSNAYSVLNNELRDLLVR